MPTQRSSPCRTPDIHTTDRSNDTAVGGHRINAPSPSRRVSTETKASVKTSELIAYVVAVIAVLIASAVTDKSDFGTQEAFRFITFLTVGYVISRGLAKSGSRDFFDDSEDSHNNR